MVSRLAHHAVKLMMPCWNTHEGPRRRTYALLRNQHDVPFHPDHGHDIVTIHQLASSRTETSGSDEVGSTPLLLFRSFRTSNRSLKSNLDKRSDGEWHHTNVIYQPHQRSTGFSTVLWAVKGIFRST